MKLTISLSNELIEKLKKHSNETGIPQSRIIAKQLEKLFKEAENEEN